jgi:hypothetical protein
MKSIKPYNSLEFLTQWYRNECDGDWEHQHCIRIETIDNPGWKLEVDISETILSGSKFPYNILELTLDRWLGVKCDNDVFSAFGDTFSLNDIIDLFKLFVEGKGIDPLPIFILKNN